MSQIDTIESALIIVAFQGIFLYLAYKILMVKAQKEIETQLNFALDVAKSYIEEWLNSEVGQKALYSIGQNVGAGAKAMITGKGVGGKYGWIETVIGVGRELLTQQKPGSAPRPAGDGGLP